MRIKKCIHNNQRKRLLNRNKMRVASRRHMQFTLEQYALKDTSSE